MILRLETSSGDAIVIEDGRIADPAARADRTVHVGDGRFHAGLINAHDHLHRNHFPRLGSPPYEDAYAWGADIHARCAAEIARAKTLDRRDALLFGALKNLLGGVTTVVHHDAWEPAFDHGFPIRVARVRTLHSLGISFSRPAGVVKPTRAVPDEIYDNGGRGRGNDGGGAGEGGRLTADYETGRSLQARHGQPHDFTGDVSDDAPLCIHLAEGVNRRAAGEVAELERAGLLDGRLLAVHTVGVEAEGIARLLAARAAVVWCPTSNHFLFGITAPRALFDSGIDTLLGTDSLLTGAGTLLDELRAARGLGYLEDARLLAAVGSTAARRLGLPSPSLEPGSPADVVLLRARPLEARSADVALVLVGGGPVLADAPVAGALGFAGEPIVADGVPKIVTPPLARAARRALTLFADSSRILTLAEA